VSREFAAGTAAAAGAAAPGCAAAGACAAGSFSFVPEHALSAAAVTNNTTTLFSIVSMLSEKIPRMALADWDCGRAAR